MRGDIDRMRSEFRRTVHAVDHSCAISTISGPDWLLLFPSRLIARRDGRHPQNGIHAPMGANFAIRGKVLEESDQDESLHAQMGESEALPRVCAPSACPGCMPKLPQAHGMTLRAPNVRPM